MIIIPCQSCVVIIILNCDDLSLFSLNENDSPPPIKSELGWHVFKILKINPKQYKSFSEARKEILENLQYKMAEMKINELLKVIEDDVASGANFQEIAVPLQERNSYQVGRICEARCLNGFRKDKY